MVAIVFGICALPLGTVIIFGLRRASNLWLLATLFGVFAAGQLEADQTRLHLSVDRFGIERDVICRGGGFWPQVAGVDAPAAGVGQLSLSPGLAASVVISGCRDEAWPTHRPAPIADPVAGGP